jgi:hypothetical protein
MCDSAGWDESKVEEDNLVFEQREAKLCVHMGKANTPFERCDSAYLKCSANAGAGKWNDHRDPCSNATLSYAMSWTGRVVPAGGEYQLLVCGGNPNDWGQPTTGVDSMNCAASTTNLGMDATIYESGNVDPTTFHGGLMLEARGVTEITHTEMTQLTATNYLVTVTLRNPTEGRITDGALALYGNLDIVAAGQNFGEIYGNSQGFLFKYNPEVFWRFIVRWTEDLSGDYEAAGWWMDFADGLCTDANRWRTPSTVPTELGDYGMSVSWQGMGIEANSEVNVSFIVGAGYRGYNMALPSPTVIPHSPTPAFVQTEREAVAATVGPEGAQEVNASEMLGTEVVVPSVGFSVTRALGFTDRVSGSEMSGSADPAATVSASVSELGRARWRSGTRHGICC